MTITSLKDGSQQRLDATSIRQWENSSAFFNGDAVEVELHVAPGEEGIFFRVQEVMLAGRESGDAFTSGRGGIAPQSICGATDDRVRWNDPAVGRITSSDPITDRVAFCTGWIASNGAHLTAGHCRSISMQILEFNVPSSTVTGTVVFADARDQYAVDRSRLEGHSGSMFAGDDWAVFGVFPNPNTGLFPVQAQGAFYRVCKPSHWEPQTVRVTGYGVDGPPPDYGDPPPRNSDNQTLQSHAGPYNGETETDHPGMVITYTVDTQPANSGGPVINTITLNAIGIHTHEGHGGCDTSGNKGTSFDNDELERALQRFPGPNTVYVDTVACTLTRDGTIFGPYRTVAEGVSAVPAGGIVSIDAGTYDDVLTISKLMTLTAPVGDVYIGW